jgi:hypothetical protein
MSKGPELDYGHSQGVNVTRFGGTPKFSGRNLGCHISELASVLQHSECPCDVVTDATQAKVAKESFTVVVDEHITLFILRFISHSYGKIGYNLHYAPRRDLHAPQAGFDRVGTPNR